MKKILSLVLCLGFVGTTSAFAADCAAVGARVAGEQGGKLTRSTPLVQDGKDMCVVIVLIPGREGERPRRVEVAVPAN